MCERDCGMSKTVLVADDDRASRVFVRSILELEGYDVLEAEDGADALGLIRIEEFDLLITDILMPGMEGIELVREARKLRPRLKTLGMTGGGEMGVHKIAHLSRTFFDAFLEKPFEQETLLSEVRELEKSADPQGVVDAR